MHFVVYRLGMGRQIEAFLLNTKLNDQGWRIDMEGLERTARNWIGTPGILHAGCMDGQCGYVHSRGRNLKDAITVSQREAVTRISDVYWDGPDLMAVHDVIREDALPVLCDPQIYATSASVWLDDPSRTDPIGSYTPVHVAFLSVNGAYGEAAEDIRRGETCNNAQIYSSGMAEESTSEEQKPEEGEPQKMSMEDEIHEIHAMLKDMQQPKEQASAASSCGGQKSAAASRKQEADWAKQWVSASPNGRRPLLVDDIPV